MLGARSVPLPSGRELPVLSYGTCALRQPQAATLLALRCGYRGVDTAANYNTATDVGIAVRTSGLPREQLYVTSKICNCLARDDGPDQDWDRIVARHLDEIGLEYLDLLLIHAPTIAPPRERLQLWRAMERAVDAGLVRSIGVSNLCA